MGNLKLQTAGFDFCDCMNSILKNLNHVVSFSFAKNKDSFMTSTTILSISTSIVNNYTKETGDFI